MIRDVRIEDAQALIDIVNYYIRNTVINFSYDEMTIETMEEMIRNKPSRFPFIVLEENNEILGYAYTSPFVGKEAYSWSQETTIYLKHSSTHKGNGKKLYTALEELCKAMGVLKLNACIGYADIEDEHLTNNSSSFHEHFGYKFVGKFDQCGYKFNKWYSMVWYSKEINWKEHPESVIPYSKLDDNMKNKILS